MKQTFILISIVSLVFNLGLSQTNNEEFRATWVITWEHISGSSSAETNKARVRQILDNHQAANMNAVIWQVRQSGTAYFNSSYEPWGYYAGGSDPGYDPLAYVIEEAHKRGMEVHAWFNVFQASSTVSGTPAAEHPEWICRDQSGIAMTSSICLSPGLQAVRDYTVDVAMEVVNNYNVDGLHLDYVRWNEYSNSKSSKQYAASNDPNRMLDGIITEEQITDLEMNKSGRYLYDVEHPYSGGVPAGFSNWEEWWRWSVTEFVRTLHDSIQTVKPWVRLSVAALGKYRWSGWQGYGTVYQDAALWFNEGYIEQLTPMHYHWTTGAGFLDMLAANDPESWDYYIQPGIAAGRLFSVGPGSYILLENKIWYRHKEIINACRTVDYVDGFQFFSYGSWNGAKYWEEAGETVFNAKTVVREINRVNTPAAPLIALNKINNLSYEITVTPDVSVTDNQWFALYRSTDNTINTNTDEIIDIHFGDQAYTVTDSFPGTQDFNGQYTYFAIMSNRYHNQSDASNSVTTDNIPSYPPELLYCSVSQNDTIAINSTITMEFSKTMDQASFASAFSIQPAAAIRKFSWSGDWKDSSRTVTIIFDGHLQVSTDYSITISSALTDVLGQSISPISINFTTEDEDLQGPLLTAIFPAQQELNFDLDNVIMIQFDELVDPETINESTVYFTNAHQPTSVSIMHDFIANQSVLNIKPYAQLFQDTVNVLTLTTGITDTLGNAMTEALNLEFFTADYHYHSLKMIDDFTNDNNWWNPTSSGGWSGVIAAGSEFSYSTSRYLPTSEVLSAKGRSGFLKYQWDTAASSFLLRQHVGDGAVTSISIDTSYILQVYIYGDGSHNKFRFSLYEKDASGNNTASTAEVSKWTTIDWIGWRLVEWDLGDPNSVGTWLSADEQMDGHHYIMEGFHLTKPDDGAWLGKIYFDNLRLVKRTSDPVPLNTAPVLTALPDTFTYQGVNLKIYPTWEDPDINCIHHLYLFADTAAVDFRITGHTSGSKVYLVPASDFTGNSMITVIVKDFGVGELADTTSFTLTVLPGSNIAQDNLPFQFQLKQNYPNPFNPTTTFQFSINKAGYTELIVFDLLGRIVSRVISQSLPAGEHSIIFNASDLPSGQYFYQLRCGENVMTKKMMLLK